MCATQREVQALMAARSDEVVQEREYTLYSDQCLSKAAAQRPPKTREERVNLARSYGSEWDQSDTE